MKKFMRNHSHHFIAAVAVVLVVGCGGGGGGGSTATATETAPEVTPTPTTSWFAPATMLPMGVKVSGASILSNASIDVGDAAWQTAVKDGTVKVVDSTVVLTGLTAKPIAWTIFTRTIPPLSGLKYCHTPVHKDDGGAIPNYTKSGSLCVTDEIDWVVSTPEGLVVHAPATNLCYLTKWNKETQTFDQPLVPCP